MSGASGVPRKKARDGSFPEYGYHVMHPIRILWMLIEYFEETRVKARVENSESGVVIQHAFVPEHVEQRQVRWL